MEILLIEDSEEIQLLVRKALGEKTRLTCSRGADGIYSLLQNKRFDLILLDIELPDSNGFQICAKLQNDETCRDIPIIFLTGNSGIDSKIMAFSVGADDYIVKPFHPAELRARIEGKIKKLRDRKEDGDSFSIGDIRVHLPSYKGFIVTREGEQDLGLTPIEFKLLFHLAKNHDNVLSREQLLSLIWGNSVHIIDRTIDTHISALRRKLGGKGIYIQSVTGIGYRLSIPMENAA